MSVRSPRKIDHITPHYRAFIEAAPFFALASAGAERARLLAARRRAGLRARAGREDAARSPTGAATTASTPCATSWRDPRVALLFLIPGCGETIRVIGRAVDLDRSGAGGRASRSTARCRARRDRGAVERVFYQCAKAIVRSKLWDAARHVDRKSLPTPARSSPISPVASSAAPSTTAPRPNA